MKFAESSRSIRAQAALTLAGALLLLVGCGARKPFFSETIVEGQQFAHYIQFPSKFEPSANAPFKVFDHYSFRVADSSPDVLLVAACLYTGEVAESCSTNRFAVDTGHAYSIHEVSPREWREAKPIAGSFEMDNSSRGVSPDEEYSKPVYERIMPLGNELGKDGYQYRGKHYQQRGEWIRNFGMVHSLDGKQVAMAGGDKRKPPKPGLISISGDPWVEGSSGRFVIDIFDSESARRIAAVDVDCETSPVAALRSVSFVSSRWFAFPLDRYFQRMLLFDFKTYNQGQTQ